MRASEQVAEGRIKSIKESDEKIKGGIKIARKIAGTAAGAGTAIAGANIAAKIAPFLSDYITPELALKGISKVSPKFGDALKRGIEGGLSLESGLDFLKQSMNKPTENQQEEENPQQNLSVIEQYSAPLYEYIKKLIENGSSPAEAAAKSKKFLDKKQLEIINKIEKDHKTDWLNIVESIFGKGETAQPQQQMQGMQQTQPQQAPQQSGQGIDPQLAQILQQGNALLQKFRGGNG